MKTRFWIALWLLLFGVWPFACPDHDGGTLLSNIDLMLHGFGIGTMVAMAWGEASRGDVSTGRT